LNKKAITIVFLIGLAVLSVSILYVRLREEKNVGQVNWLFDYDAGVAKAGAENKIVLIDFYADWCSWCKVLDQETYGNREVASYLNEKFVCIKVDADSNASLSKNYNVTGLPTIVFLSSSGKEVGRILGYVSSNLFLTNAKNIASRYG